MMGRRKQRRGTMRCTPGVSGTVPGVMGTTPGVMPVNDAHVHAEPRAEAPPVRVQPTKPEQGKISALIDRIRSL